MRFVCLLSILASCVADTDSSEMIPSQTPRPTELVEKCSWPPGALLRTVELSGNCGHQTPVVIDRWDPHAAGDPTCIATNVQRTSCFRSFTQTCSPTAEDPTSAVISLWLDGAHGSVWHGELDLRITDRGMLVCQSHYAATLEPR